MAQPPVVGVLILVWDRPMFIRQTAHAVRQEGFDPLIWDDGSTCEYTAHELGRLREEGFKVCRCEKNLGRDAPENAALETFIRDGCDVLVSMEDGCWLLPGTLQEMISVLRSDDHLGAVGPLLNVPDIPEQYRAVEDPEFERVCRDGALAQGRSLLPRAQRPRWRTILFTDPGCWAIRAECWRAVGGTDTSFWMGWGMANDFCYRARTKGFLSAVALDAYAYMADHGPDHLACHWSRPGIGDPAADSIRHQWEAQGERRMREKYGSVPDAYATFKSNFEEIQG